MARERISLVPESVKQEATLESRIRTGEITPHTFHQLSPEEQRNVHELLFKMASEKINPNQGASVLEFILFGFIRIMNKKVAGMSLTEDEQAIQASLDRLCATHEITNTQMEKADWLFDYLGYAEEKATEILQNRQEHIARKQTITGEV